MMTEQISRERIEAMARWLGFSWHEQREYVHDPLTHGGEYIDGHWDYRGSCHYDIGDGMGSKIHIPDFPNDIAACFKWISASVYQRGYFIHLDSLRDDEGITYRFQIEDIVREEDHGYADIIACAIAQLPSMAFFLAAEQLKKAEEEK